MERKEAQDILESRVRDFGKWAGVPKSDRPSDEQGMVLFLRKQFPQVQASDPVAWDKGGYKRTEFEEVFQVLGLYPLLEKPAKFDEKPFWAPFEYPGLECPGCHHHRFSYLGYCSWCGHNPASVPMVECAICSMWVSPQEDGAETDAHGNVFCHSCATPVEMIISW